MFCVNCGNKLPDDAGFCSNCGAKLTEVKGKSEYTMEELVEDNKVKLSINPTFKFGYEILPLMLFTLMFALFMSALMFIISTKCGIYTLLVALALGLIFLIIETVYTKKLYEKREYCFYNTKVVFKDTFISRTEKEIKYKHIREVSLHQTYFQRMFGLGTIFLYTNAESGMSNGLIIRSIANAREIYAKVKEITKS